MPNFQLIHSNPEPLKNCLVVEIDGLKVSSLKVFFDKMSKALSFPDDFEFNLESFDDMMYDLSWLNVPKIVLYFTNFEAFLSTEKATKRAEVLEILDVAAEEWKWVDEDEGIPQKELNIWIQYSPKTAEILQAVGIGFEVESQ
ncbi:MAG: barstar family protein [Runella sp.]